MPARSKIEQLPEVLRQQLNEKLLQNGFSDYEQLAEWLTQNGYQISHASVWRYGQKFEQRVEGLRRATEQAKAIVTETGDDEGAMLEATQKLLTEKTFQLLMEIDLDPDEVNITKVGRMISDLTRAHVHQQKWKQEIQERAHEAAVAVESVAKKGGLTADAVEQIKRQILGIAA